jgi:single-strand DNA-binding protein
MALTCRLTRDPEVRHTPSGTAVCSMRVAWTTSRKSADSGEWEDKSNFIDVTVWGRQAETCGEHLSKGRRIGIDGRLEWREWEAQDGSKRQAYEIVAEGIVFLDYADKDGQQSMHPSQQAAAEDHDSYVPAGAGNVDDDIPF